MNWHLICQIVATACVLAFLLSAGTRWLWMLHYAASFTGPPWPAILYDHAVACGLAVCPLAVIWGRM